MSSRPVSDDNDDIDHPATDTDLNSSRYVDDHDDSDGDSDMFVGETVSAGTQRPDAHLLLPNPIIPVVFRNQIFMVPLDSDVCEEYRRPSQLVSEGQLSFVLHLTLQAIQQFLPPPFALQMNPKASLPSLQAMMVARTTAAVASANVDPLNGEQARELCEELMRVSTHPQCCPPAMVSPECHRRNATHTSLHRSTAEVVALLRRYILEPKTMQAMLHVRYECDIQPRRLSAV
jgi:hypothetical protein